MTARREPVTTTRAVRVQRVPDGTPVELPEGTDAWITQALGTSFTLLAGGQLLRMKGSDADAIGRPVPRAPEPPPGDVTAEAVQRLVWQTLATCYDPEIPVDIVALGLVYGCDIVPAGDGRFVVTVSMTLTAPGCGMGEVLIEEVCDKLLALPPVAEATVGLVFDPPWDRYRMSEAAQLALGL